MCIRDRVYGNHWAVHHDPKLWDHPEKFNPERFINNKGKFVPSPHVMPYGYGARHCVGMKMADWLVFHCITAVVRKFKLLPEHGQLPSSDEYIFGTVNSPLPFKVKFQQR